MLYIIISIYLIWIPIFYLLDAYIGFAIDFDGNGNPPLILAALIWPIALPCFIVISFLNFCDRVKVKRLNRISSYKIDEDI